MRELVCACLIFVFCSSSCSLIVILHMFVFFLLRHMLKTRAEMFSASCGGREERVFGLLVGGVFQDPRESSVAVFQSVKSLQLKKKSRIYPQRECHGYKT